MVLIRSLLKVSVSSDAFLLSCWWLKGRTCNQLLPFLAATSLNIKCLFKSGLTIDSVLQKSCCTSWRHKQELIKAQLKHAGTPKLRCRFKAECHKVRLSQKQQEAVRGSEVKGALTHPVPGLNSKYWVVWLMDFPQLFEEHSNTPHNFAASSNGFSYLSCDQSQRQ